MVKQHTKIQQDSTVMNTRPYIKNQSLSIQKSMATDTTAMTSHCQVASFKKAQMIPARQATQVGYHMVFGQQPAFVAPTQTIAYTGGQAVMTNVIQLVPQIVIPQPVFQQQVLIPIETLPVAQPVSQKQIQQIQPSEIAENASHSHSCCSEHKKGGVTAQSSTGHISARHTAVSGGSSSEGDVEIEIPGGFDNINSFENSSNVDDECDEYVKMPKLDKWIGLDWDEISITSDASQNRKDW